MKSLAEAVEEGRIKDRCESYKYVLRDLPIALNRARREFVEGVTDVLPTLEETFWPWKEAADAALDRRLRS